MQNAKIKDSKIKNKQKIKTAQPVSFTCEYSLCSHDHFRVISYFKKKLNHAFKISFYPGHGHDVMDGNKLMIV